METELWSGDTKAIITQDGAWITNVSDENGDVLFPKRTLKNAKGEAKERGGCHVCLPNFGPGGQSGLTQHGFGRELLWEKDETTADSMRLGLRVSNGIYSGLKAQLTYALEDYKLRAELVVENTGEHSFDLAPGFHPYFVAHGEAVRINGETYDVSQLAEAQFIDADVVTLETDSRFFRLQSSSLGKWALWTDQLGPYVCVEPTRSGFSFAETGVVDTLAPSETKSYAFSLEWRLSSETANG